MSRESILEDFSEILSKLEVAIDIAVEIEQATILEYLQPVYREVAEMRDEFNRDDSKAEEIKSLLANSINLRLANLTYRVDLKAIECPERFRDLDVNADEERWYFNYIYQPITLGISRLAESLDGFALEESKVDSPDSFSYRRRSLSAASLSSVFSNYSSSDDDEVFTTIAAHLALEEHGPRIL